jgi:hypothetical protein
MQALEIQASVKDGVLQIPKLPTPLADGDVKLIVLYEEPSVPRRNYDLEKMEAAFQKISEKDIFKTIQDPVAWQRQQRDEWE